MKTLKLYVHSFIDVITNSSTEMFVDQSKCLEPCRQMINEMLAAFDIDKSCGDLFDLTLENDDEEAFGDESVSTLTITAKDPQYQAMANKIMNLLGSVDTKEIYC